MSKRVPVKSDEVQGIILRGYEKLEAARFVLLKITDPVAARRWLGELANDLTSAKVKPDNRAVNIAFTWTGWHKLGVPDEKTPAIEIRRDKSGHTDLVLNLISASFTLDKPRTVTFAFQATPVKPMHDGWRMDPWWTGDSCALRRGG